MVQASIKLSAVHTCGAAGAGHGRPGAWLRARQVRGAGKLAAAAVVAASAQSIRLPGEGLAARLIADLAEGVLALHAQVKEADELIEGRFRRHPAAEVICSLPGVEVLLGAGFLAATGGDMAAFGTPDRLAAWPASRRVNVLWALLRDGRCYELTPPKPPEPHAA